VKRGSFLFVSRPAFGLVLGGGLSLSVDAITLPPSAPPLPPPSGAIVSVSTVTQLQSAVSTLASNTAVLIAPAGDLTVLCEQASRSVQVIIDVNGYFQ
jgi:hypothetical protein